MKTTIIPAQITTIEDKIAGSLTLTQICLLLIPLFWTGVVYVVLPAPLEFSFYKFPLILFVLITSIAASLRISEKLVITWIVIMLKYYARPGYFLADKNDLYLRSVAYPKAPLVKKAENQKKSRKEAQIPARQSLAPGNFALNFKFEKGELYVEKI